MSVVWTSYGIFRYIGISKFWYYRLGRGTSLCRRHLGGTASSATYRQTYVLQKQELSLILRRLSFLVVSNSLSCELRIYYRINRVFALHPVWHPRTFVVVVVVVIGVLRKIYIFKACVNYRHSYRFFSVVFLRFCRYHIRLDRRSISDI